MAITGYCLTWRGMQGSNLFPLRF
ncbi:hypothetical protein PSHT_13796 [Puccinia striiformis]|uniref:Uncharacterized protein n=1 Tax=Puccinia striiformis TaxID=27350 RepID=A0A2S4UNP8_9BASI|nr:hypothetical protein PSHT_13796 [Puccinia striiformis]